MEKRRREAERKSLYSSAITHASEKSKCACKMKF